MHDPTTLLVADSPAAQEIDWVCECVARGVPLCDIEEELDRRENMDPRPFGEACEMALTILLAAVLPVVVAGFAVWWWMR